ncbi:MAG: flagellar protein FlaG [Proteobacteria bacterium]|nr:flagellar protein FlaG [Burkholderiales bacterium]
MQIQPTTPAYSGPGRIESAPRQTEGEALRVPARPDPDAESGEDAVKAVKAAVEASNRVVQALQSKIEFVTDDSSGRVLIKVIDPSNNQIIRQIPSEEMLAISRALDRMQGLLVKSKA